MELISFLSLLLVFATNFANGMSEASVTYEEVKNLAASCNTLDNCKHPRAIDSLSTYTCHCGAFCSHLDTCCIDSPYTGDPKTDYPPSCKNVHGRKNLHYFMIDSCPSHTNTADSIWYQLCEKDDYKDLMSLVPVTSLSSNLTYKNYFCYKCHEKGDIYRYWNVKVFSNLESSKEQDNNAIIIYNKDNDTWMARLEEGNFVPVTFSIKTPHDILDLAKICIPNVISNCSDKWQEDIVQHKCNMYTSIVYIHKNEQTISYKNPHCALCNFESLEKMICALETQFRQSPSGISFPILMGYNPFDRNGGNCGEGSVWDPFANRCRTLYCVLPNGDVRVQNGEC